MWVFPLCGEADPAALHADLQAVGGLAAGVHDAAVHVAGAVAVVAQVVAAATAAGLRAADPAGRLRHHHVAQGEELAEQAGQDAVHAAVFGGGARFVGGAGAGLALPAAVAVHRQAGLQLALDLVGNRRRVLPRLQPGAIAQAHAAAILALARISVAGLHGGGWLRKPLRLSSNELAVGGISPRRGAPPLRRRLGGAPRHFLLGGR